MSTAVAGAVAPQRTVRPLKDRVVWRLAGHGGWVTDEELAKAFGGQEVAAALAALAGAGVVEARCGVGWRLAGPALAREAARELVRRAKNGLRRHVLTGVDGEVVNLGLAEVQDGGPDGGGLGFLLVQMVAPLPPGSDGLDRLQALVERWCAAVNKGVFDV